MEKARVIRQIAWQSVVLQFLLIIIVFSLAVYVFGYSRPTLIVAILIYAIYHFTAKFILERPVSQGLQFIRKDKFTEAADQFKYAYRFYTRNAWIDRFRYALILASPMTFREMSIFNLAISYACLDDKENSLLYCQQALAQFPNSALKPTALEIIRMWNTKSSPP